MFQHFIKKRNERLETKFNTLINYPITLFTDLNNLQGLHR